MSVPIIAVANVSSTGVIAEDIGIASVNHSATGTYIVSLVQPTTGMVAFVTCHAGFGAPGAITNADGTITVSTVNTSSVAADAHFHLLVAKASNP